MPSEREIRMMRRRARPGVTRVAGVLAVFVAGLTGCAGVSGTALPAGSRPASSAASSPAPSAAAGTTGPADTSGTAAGSGAATPGAQPTAEQPMAAATPTARPLAGQVIALDPGHNGANWSHPAIINRLVNVISEWKACDTTGAQTDAGYPEHAFNFNVAMRLARLLRTEGATVVLTRHNDRGVGPCVTQRAAIGNRAHADAAISIHADGGPPTGTGFEVISPGRIPGAPDTAIIGPSGRLAVDIRNAYHRITKEPYSDYVGVRGLDVRTDLGGLNLSTVPKVFIECGNMRNASDAARLTSPRFRERIAVALAAGFTAFLNRHS
ncbi:MAG TPA: N-acetylmuramoyl-L-alanine amidase [Streptosporangiaceae bacterium]|nr:N-acetylmuramoyl-L-alanine amidase [Streptosporangiaceae bacterium]